jgi:tRNA(adenine34) deaminase
LNPRCPETQQFSRLPDSAALAPLRREVYNALRSGLWDVGAVVHLSNFIVMDNITNDELFMRAALDIAMVAATHDDVPVGCVLVEEDKVIGVGENRRERDQDPTAHAELVALRDAALSRPSWRMDDVTAYVTLEPCVMCAGALLNARVRRVVIGALDEKAGAVGSRYNVLSDPRLLHEASLTYGVLGEESAQLLRVFFQERR